MCFLRDLRRGNTKFAYTAIKEVNKTTPTIVEALKATTGAPTASKGKEEDEEKVLGAESAFGSFGDLRV